MKRRSARPSDVPAIHSLIKHYSDAGVLLPRTEEDIWAHCDRFLVIEECGAVVGTVALEPYGPELAEIRSLAVAPGSRGQGLGAKLVRYSLYRARRRKFARVFAVTHAPAFFLRLGFASSLRAALPEKIERDCTTCPKRRRCRLAAVVAVLAPERVVLPVLDSASAPLPIA